MTQRRKATPEQKARAKERRKQFALLARQIAKMDEGERIRLASKVQIHSIEGRTLSVHNQCLLALQRPDATVVGGFRQWKRAGRCVRKGEHGSMIWVPTLPADKRDTNEEHPEESETSDLRFLVATVFDVAQTAELDTKTA